MRIFMIKTKTEKKKFLIVFDDMIADIMSNKKFQAVVKELFIRCTCIQRKFKLNSTHYLIYEN